MRNSDKSIMQCALDNYDNISILKVINRVMMQHNGATLVDMCLSNGNELDGRNLQSKNTT